ncbi:MAG TPA: hypothetical protein VNX28_02690 [Gemmataceae bacterium]|nr:hypothetical protein [Gemmataceae bacterium]
MRCWLRVWRRKKTSVVDAKPRAKRPRLQLDLEALESRELLAAAVVLATPTPMGPSGSVASAEPTFTWSAVTGADSYDVWVDDQTSNQSQVLRNQAVVGTSWTDTTPLNVGDTYSWYVRAIDSADAVVGFWSNTLSFTITALGTPTLIGPSGSVSSAEPAFTWNAVAGADHYDVVVNNQTTGQTSVFRNQDVAGTSWTPPTPLPAGDRYMWWVRALDNSGANSGPWSSSLSFSVASLGQPTVVGPTGTVIGDTPTFSWNAALGADHYDVWVSDLTTGQSPVIRNEDVLDTSWTPSTALTPGHSYRWWVRAVDSTNTNDGPWSASANVAVAPFAQPALIGPSGPVITGAPTFTWNAVVGADHYDVWVDDTTTGRSAVFRDQDVVGTSWSPATPLKPGDNYRWWVRAVDTSSSNFGAWSTALNVSVTPLAAPVLIGPSGSVAGVEPTFTWNAVAGADHYDVWVDDTTTGRSAVFRNQDVVGPSWTPPTPLNSGDKYRLWVRAVDSSSTNFGAWSTTLNVTVTPLAAPTLIGPSGSMTSAEPAFSWNAVTGADHYDITVNDQTTHQSALLRNQDVAGTTWTPLTPLTPGHKYRWWVRAIDSTGANQGTWSGALDFTVAVLAAPTLIGPKGPGAGAEPTFTWDVVVGADHYDVYVNDLTTGHSGVLRNQDVVGTSWMPTTSLTAGHKYRWWVRAVDSTGTNQGAWSASFDFTVAAISG